MSLLPRAVLLLTATFAALLAAGPADAAIPAGTVAEFSAGISAGAGLGTVAAGPDGNLWFTETSQDRIGRITPAGVVTEFNAGISAGAAPLGIAVGADGNLWFTESGSTSRVGRITPAGVVTEFVTGITATGVLRAIAAGADGNLWFTESSASGNRVGRITPAGVVTEFSAGITAASAPTGIAAGPDGNLTEAAGSRIGRITTAGVVTEFNAGVSGGTPVGIAAGPDGNLWFTKGDVDRVAKITPAGGVTEVATAVGAQPTGIAAGPDGNLWFTEAGSTARVGRVTTSGTITEFTAGITAASQPNAIAAGPDGNLWFSEAAGNRIARVGSGVNVVVRAPAVYGAGRVGERALCDEGAWKASLDIGSYRYQWLLDGAEIAGATLGEYTPVAGDEAHQLGCRVAAGSASVLALYTVQSSTITVGAQAVGPAGPLGPLGPSGPSGSTGSPGVAGSAAATGAGGAPGAAGTSGANGGRGARGAAAIAASTAAILHARLTTTKGKSLTIRYLAGKGMRLVLTARRRGAHRVVRLAALTTRKAGRGSVSVRIALPPGAHTLVLTIVGAASARAVDAVPLIVRTR